MPINYETAPVNQMRRKDRGKDESWIKQYLVNAGFCSIATMNSGRPFINQNIFYYDEKNNAIYFHTSREGRLRYNVEKEAKVCFCVGEMGRLLPADVALEFSVEYKSVVVFGSVEIIEAEEESKAALQKLMKKYFPDHIPGEDYRAIIPEEIKRTSVFKINIESMSGKEKKVEENFKDAFDYKSFSGKNI